MAKFDIWCEGCLYTGCEGIPIRAKCYASAVEGIDFLDAVRKWYSSVPNAETKYGPLLIIDGEARTWGCRLFDNEIDARKSYG